LVALFFIGPLSWVVLQPNQRRSGPIYFHYLAALRVKDLGMGDLHAWRVLRVVMFVRDPGLVLAWDAGQPADETPAVLVSGTDDVHVSDGDPIEEVGKRVVVITVGMRHD